MWPVFKKLSGFLGSFKNAATPEKDEGAEKFIVLDRNNVPLEDEPSVTAAKTFLDEAYKRGKSISDEAGTAQTDETGIPDLKDISEDEILAIIQKDCGFVILKDFNNMFEQETGNNFVEEMQKLMDGNVFGKMTQRDAEGTNLLLFALCEKGLFEPTEATGKNGGTVGIYPIEGREVLEARRIQIMAEGLKEMGFVETGPRNDME